MKVTVYSKSASGIKSEDGIKALDIPKEDMVWIDVMEPDRMSVMAMDVLIRKDILTASQVKEIEGASEFSDSSDLVNANPNFFVLKDHSLQVEPVAFIITSEGLMISLRHSELDPFNDLNDEIKDFAQKKGLDKTDGFSLFVRLLQNRIARDASTVEFISHEIAELSKDISGSSKIEKDILYRIIALQEKTMVLRENTFDLQKVVTGIRRSHNFSEEQHAEAELMLNDVDSLISHAEFGFQRLDYFQDTALGLINIQQNETTKIFSVVAVVFMPPTLVASVYGMNFKYMPELNWAWTLSNGWIIPAGYFFALFLMLLFTLLTLWFFRYKKWL